MNEPTNPGIHPLGNLILLDITPKELKLPSGLVLPTAVQGNDTKKEGVIVSFGPDCTRTDLKAGMKVLVGTYASNDIEREGIKYRLALENDILASLDDIAPSMPPPVIKPIRPY